MMNMVDHALDYASRGWPVFPLSQDKMPLTPRDKDENGQPIDGTGGFYKASCDEAQIREWWTKHPAAMIGIRSGSASGVWAIDPDVPKESGDLDGLTYWHNLVAANGGIPLTHTHTTPSGGLHVVFRWTADRPVRNKEGRLKNTGINVRGEGGYFVAPPSERRDGKSYQVLEPLDFFNIAEAPDWLYELVLPAKELPRERSISERARAAVQPPDGAYDAYVRTAVDGEYNAVAGALKGGRNGQLNTSAFNLGTLVAAGVLAEGDVETVLLDAASQNGEIRDYGERHIMGVIRSGMQAGMKNPRELPAPDAPQGGPMERLIARASVKGKNDNVPPPPRPERRVYYHGDPNNPKQGPELAAGLLPQRGVGLIAGQSRAGKSFTGVDLAGSVMSGQDFFGCRIKRQGSVIYLAGEAIGTVERRVEAMRLGKLGDTAPSRMPFAWWGVSGLAQPGAIDAEIAEIKQVAAVLEANHSLPLALIIVDTIAAAFGFEDENSAPEATKNMQALERMSYETGALVLGIAHYGKDVSTGVRGSSGLTASADAILAVQATIDLDGNVSNRKLSLTKSRDGETGWTCPFELETVTVSHDEEGCSITSAFVQPNLKAAGTASAAKKETKVRGATKAYLDALRNVLGDRGIEMQPYGANGPKVIVVDVEDVRREFYRLYLVDGETEEKKQEARRKQHNRGRSGAFDGNFVCFHHVGNKEWVWLASKATEQEFRLAASAA